MKLKLKRDFHMISGFDFVCKKSTKNIQLKILEGLWSHLQEIIRFKSSSKRSR